MKKYRNHALVAGVLCLALALGILAGCDNGKNVSSIPPVSSSVLASSQEPVSSAASSEEASSQEASSVAASSNQNEPTESQAGIVLPIETDSKEYDKKFEANSIDTAYKKELNEAFSNNDMIAVSDKYTEVWKQEISAAVKYLESAASGDEKAKLQKEQQDWEGKTPEALKKIAQEADAVGGSLGAVDASSQTMDYYRNRANALYRTVYNYNQDFQFAFKS